MEQSIKQLNLKLILPIIAFIGLTTLSNKIIAAPRPKPIVNVAHISKELRFFSDAECTDFVLRAAGETPIVIGDPVEQTSARMQQVANLPNRSKVTVFLTITDHFLDNNHAAEDNKPQKGLAMVPWMGHLERIIFVLKYAKIPIDQSAIDHAITLLEKYRGTINPLILKNPKSEFNIDLLTLIDEVPKLIEAAINLAPECGSVCDPAAIANVKFILEHYRATTNIKSLSSLLDELKPYLSTVIQNKNISDRTERISKMVAPENSARITQRMIDLTFSNKRFIGHSGIAIRD